MAALRYTLIGKARTAKDDLHPLDRLLAGRRFAYYVFTANRPLQCCAGDTNCQHTIEPGEQFIRAEVNQRTERFSRWPACQQCRPFTLAEEGTAHAPRRAQGLCHTCGIRPAREENHGACDECARRSDY